MIRKSVLLVVCLLFLFPIYWMVQGSFQTIVGRIPTPPRFIPLNPTVIMYREVLTQEYIGYWAINSLLVFAGYVASGIVVNGLAGYAFAFLKFPGKTVIFWLFISSLILSRYTLLIPQYVVARKLQMPGMVAVFAMIAFWPAGIYLFRNYFESIPKSIIECARIDGAGNFAIFRKIILPLSLPIIGVAVISKGIEAFSDFIWQLLNLQGEKEKTLLVGLIQATRTRLKSTGGMFPISAELATGTLLLIPLILLFAFANKYFIKGIVTGAVKE